MGTAMLLYDADCGFCARAARAVLGLGIDVEVRSLHLMDLRSLGVDPARARQELPFIDADGVVRYGHEAVAAILTAGGRAPLALAGRVIGHPWVSPLARVVYHWVAAHRHQLPGGTRACAVDPAP